MKRTDVPVKNVRNSLCILDCSASFTLVRRNYLNEKAIETSTSKMPGGKNFKTGGSAPTFLAFSRPKSFRGRSRPLLAECDQWRVAVLTTPHRHAARSIEGRSFPPTNRPWPNYFHVPATQIPFQTLNWKLERQVFCHSEMVSGERGIKYPVHRPVHHAVHQGGQRNLHMTRGMRTAERITLHVAKTQVWAGATPLHCRRIGGGRSSPIDLR